MYERTRCRRRYDRLKAEGLCVHCGKPKGDSTLLTCAPCSELARKHSRARMARLRKAWRGLGLCIICGKNEAMEECSTCGPCSEAGVEKTVAKQQVRAATGLCRDCGKPRDREGTICRRCADSRLKRYHARKAP